jgi:hypothetical protein
VWEEENPQSYALARKNSTLSSAYLNSSIKRCKSGKLLAFAHALYKNTACSYEQFRFINVKQPGPRHDQIDRTPGTDSESDS